MANADKSSDFQTQLNSLQNQNKLLGIKHHNILNIIKKIESCDWVQKQANVDLLTEKNALIKVDITDIYSHIRGFDSKIQRTAKNVEKARASSKSVKVFASGVEGSPHPNDEDLEISIGTFSSQF